MRLNANTLRAAVNYANNESFPIVIQFNAAKFNGGSANTITLTSGLTLGPIAPAGTHTYKFVGPTAKPIVVSGAGLYNGFHGQRRDLRGIRYPDDCPRQQHGNHLRRRH